MAEDKGLSAEQQLLKLIEGDSKPQTPAPAQGAPAQAGPVKARPVPIFSFDALKGRFSFIQTNIRSITKGKDMDLTLSLVNNVLIIIICAMFLFIGYQIMSGPQKFKAIGEISAAKRQSAEDTAFIDEPKDYSFYSEKMKARDIFRVKPKEIKIEDQKQKTPASTITETIKDLKLVGLSPSENKADSFAMIENTKNQTTSFLKIGDSITGLTVKDILADKVIFTDGAENSELK